MKRSVINDWVTYLSIIMVYAAAIILCSTSNGPTVCRILSIVIMMVAATVVLVKKIKEIREREI